jgi:hypothetical protein
MKAKSTAPYALEAHSKSKKHSRKPSLSDLSSSTIKKPQSNKKKSERKQQVPSIEAARICE